MFLLIICLEEQIINKDLLRENFERKKVFFHRKLLNVVICGTGVFVRCTKILRFAADERAPRRLSLKCEPIVVAMPQQLGEKPRLHSQKQKDTDWCPFVFV